MSQIGVGLSSSSLPLSHGLMDMLNRIILDWYFCMQKIAELLTGEFSY